MSSPILFHRIGEAFAIEQALFVCSGSGAEKPVSTGMFRAIETGYEGEIDIFSLVVGWRMR